jgi:hypothetical protein
MTYHDVHDVYTQWVDAAGRSGRVLAWAGVDGQNVMLHHACVGLCGVGWCGGVVWWCVVSCPVVCSPVPAGRRSRPPGTCRRGSRSTSTRPPSSGDICKSARARASGVRWVSSILVSGKHKTSSTARAAALETERSDVHLQLRRVVCAVWANKDGRTGGSGRSCSCRSEG